MTSGMLQVLFTESAAAYMGGVRAVVGPSIEEEEATEPPSAPVSALPTVALLPVPIGPAGDETAVAPSAPSTEKAMQPEKIDSDPMAESPADPLPVVTAEPEPATDVIGEKIPPDLCTPLTVCVDEAPPLVASGVLPDDMRHLSATDTPLTVCVDEAPPLVASGVLPDDVRQLPATDTPTVTAEPPERDMLLMVAPSAPVDPPTPPEPSTGMDDQKISPVEELAQGFAAVTLEIVDKPPEELLERPKTPRALTDRDRECYYVTTDYGPSDDERNGAKPPEHDIPVDAHRDSAAAFVASPLTCDEESLCTKSRRKANETFVRRSIRASLAEILT